MTAARLKFAELEIILEQLQERIDKVYRIMYAQDIKLLTPAIDQYRQNYLQAQQDHVKSIQAPDAGDHRPDRSTRDYTVCVPGMTSQA